ncbi:cupredoxin domain-containing protein [Candidatus Gracilibacteria bacterium]|nr:cupredoxin domain-containing protein [Candidatus Gracilibacteria bacterium]
MNTKHDGRRFVALVIAFLLVGCNAPVEAPTKSVESTEVAPVVVEEVVVEKLVEEEEDYMLMEDEMLLEQEREQEREQAMEEDPMLMEDEMLLEQEREQEREQAMEEDPMLMEEELFEQEQEMMEDLEPEQEVNEFELDEVGLNVVSEEGEVVTPEGVKVRVNVKPFSEGAPKQSESLSEEDVPEAAKILEISSVGGYVPTEFTVSRGEAVTLTIKSTDDKTHIFRFESKDLEAIAVGIGPNEMRAISFNAPETAGEYVFFSDVPGQKNLTGKMIVK